MPSRRRRRAGPSRRRRSRELTAAILAAWASRPAGAWADHGGATTPVGGFGFGWLVVSGAVAALGLALWAFFAPERPAEPADDAPDRAAEPPADPPAERPDHAPGEPETAAGDASRTKARERRS